MQGNLALLEMPLASIESGTEQDLDGEIDGLRLGHVLCQIDDAVRADTEDREQVQAVVVDERTDEVDSRGGECELRHGEREKKKEEAESGNGFPVYEGVG